MTAKQTASRVLSLSYISLAVNLQSSGKLPRLICRRNMLDALEQNPQLNRKQTHLGFQTDDDRDFWVCVSTQLIFGRRKMEEVGWELQLHACRGKEQNHSSNNPNNLETSLLTLPIVPNRHTVQQQLFVEETG